jgi:hypothetical protein
MGGGGHMGGFGGGHFAGAHVGGFRGGHVAGVARGRGFGGRRFVGGYRGYGLGCPYYTTYAWPYACTY